MEEFNQQNFEKIILNKIEKENLRKIISVVDKYVNVWEKRNEVKENGQLEDIHILKTIKEAGIDVSKDFFSPPGIRSENELDIKSREIDNCSEEIKKISEADFILKKLKSILEEETWEHFLFLLEDNIYEGWNNWENTVKINLVKLLN